MKEIVKRISGMVEKSSVDFDENLLKFWVGYILKNFFLFFLEIFGEYFENFEEFFDKI